MKRLVTYAAALLTLLAISSCGSKSDWGKDIEYIPVQLESNGTWSMMGPDGKLLFEDEFTKKPSPVTDGIFTVWEDKGYSVYHASSKPELVGELEGLYNVGYHNDGRIVFSREKERISVADSKGNVVFTIEPINDKEIVKSEPAFSDGLLMIVDEEGLYGYIDKNGKVAMNPCYQSATSFVNGYAFVSEDNDGSVKNYFIDKNFKKTEYRDDLRLITPFHCGKAVMYDGERYYFMDTKGELTKLPEKVNDVEYYTNDLYIFFNDGYYGIMSMKNDVLTRPKFESINAIIGESNKFLARINGNFVIIDKNGETKKELDFKNVFSKMSPDFPLIAREGNNYILINLDGKPISKTEFNDFNTVLNSNYVSSDFFNEEAALEAFFKPATDNSLAGITPGTPAAEILEGVDRWKVNTYPTYSYDLLNKESRGFKYYISYKVYFSAYPYSYNWSSGTSFNQNSTVSYVQSQLTASTDFVTDNTYDKIRGYFTSKGFEEEPSMEDNALAFSKNGYGYTVEIKSGNQISMSIYQIMDY